MARDPFFSDSLLRRDPFFEEFDRFDHYFRDSFHRFFDDPIFREPVMPVANNTFEKAKHLLDEASKNGKPHLEIPRNDELVRSPDGLDRIYERFKDRNDAKVQALSYSSSSITRDGKTVKVEKESRLNPDGTIKVKAHEEFMDPEGHKESKTRRNRIKLGHAIANGPKQESIQQEQPQQQSIENNTQQPTVENRTNKQIKDEKTKRFNPDKPTRQLETRRTQTSR